VNATHTVPAAGELAVPFVRLDRDDPELLEDLLEEVRSVAADSAFILGRHVDAFEADFADYCESEHAVGVGSGTDALLLALRAVGVGPGDEVIVPANTFIATAEAVSLAGAVPRLVDPDSETGLLTAELVQAALTPRVRCIVPVHLYGATVDMDPILDLARAAGIPVIEDACQAHGARYKGRRVGSIGAAGCFSFYPAKNLGAWGDGGAVVTNDEALADTVRLLRSHGERPRYHHRVVGTTSRLDGLQAAVLRVKLRRLAGWNDDRRQAADALRRALHGANVDLPLLPVAEGDHVYHLFAIRCDDRDGLREHLASRGIAAAVHYPVPIHRTEAYADLGLGRGSMPVAERAAERVLSLPLFPGMTGEEIAAVAAAVHDWQ
jgi:dTDP-3-amino-3,4,6-trideoxy-alpha-D-glucose transaminase